MEEIKVTRHAYERIKERTGYALSKAQAIAEKAFYCGKGVEDFPKQMRKYLSNVLQRSKDEGKGDVLRVMGNDIYIFGNCCLITTFPFPPKIVTLKSKKQANRRFRCDGEID